MIRRHGLVWGSLALAGCGILFAVFATRTGAAVLTREFLSRHPQFGEVSFASLSGTLMRTLRLTDIEVSGSSWLPAGSLLQIQSLGVQTRIGRGIALDIRNARVRHPDAGTVAFFGTYRGTGLDLSVYTARLAVHALRDTLTGEFPSDLRIVVSDVDMVIRGTAQRPVIAGTLTISSALRGPLSLYDARCSIDLEARRDEGLLFGTVRIAGGRVVAPHGVRAELRSSTVTFVGPLKAPLLDLHALAFVEGTRITGSLTGTPDAPAIDLTSVPPLPQERLLFMLATGRSWKSVDGVSRQGSQAGISADVIKDFVDFFILGGSASRAAARLGIKNVAVTFTELEKGAALSLGLTQRFDARYGIKQTLDAAGAATTAYTVGGEYQVLDKVFVGAQQETTQAPPAAVSTGAYGEQGSEGNRTIYMKFKTEF